MSELLERLELGDRATLEMVVDRLVGLLDRMDGDPDLEPSLGWPHDGPDTVLDEFGYDAEFDEAESGLGDYDGLLEQMGAV